jgi:hypothetical protein
LTSYEIFHKVIPIKDYQREQKMKAIKFGGYILSYLMCISFFSVSNEKFDNPLGINKVILWGHKLHSHTHSYIHWGFYRAFQHLGYDTYWFDNADNLQNFDFSNSLFITEGQVDQLIPLREDCFYILHNVDQKKYKNFYQKGHSITLQVYTHDVLSRDVEKIDDCMYVNITEQIIYLPWATDLLPFEIDQIKSKLPAIIADRSNSIYFVGSIGGGVFGNISQYKAFQKACNEQGVILENSMKLNMEKNIELIQQSYIAPSIQGEWQCEKGYIPCRIFKNISYGQLGVTNSKTVYELFKKKIVYNPDCYQLFFDAHEKIKNLDIDELYDVMDFVRDKHTYINRINMLLNFIKKVQDLHREA